jgi:cell division protein FtsL
MTIIASAKNDTTITLVIATLAALLLVSAATLVIFYNRSVNLSHALLERQEAIKEQQTRNSELQDGIFALLTKESMESIAARYGLVKERNPHYIESRVPQWDLASR